MSELPSTRKEARALGSRWFFTGKPCPYGHIAPRFTSVNACKECGRVRAAQKLVHTTSKRRAYNDQKSFIEAATKKHLGRYLYDKVQYINAHGKVAITCREHGVFYQNPTNHMQGKGCPACSGVATGKRSRSNLEQFLSAAKSIWGDRWDYSCVVYTKAHDKIEIGCRIHGLFTQTPTNHLTGKLACPKCNHTSSLAEDEVMRFAAIFGRAVQRDRQVIKPKELDIYLPDHKLAIEYCGEYWHSSSSKGEEAEMRYRHIKKYQLCREAGVRLLTLYETEWKTHNYAVRRLIRNALGKSRGKVMARKCALGRVPHAIARAFYDRYHPQGGAGNGDHYGLFWKGKLVACMRFTFGANDRGKTERVWTLTRYATRITVAGGASRLFQAFVREQQPTEVKSFSDNRFFDGGMYRALGFSLEEELGPDYMVYHPKFGLLPKSHYQRRMIPKRLEELGINEKFDPKTDPRTEAEMTYFMGARRLYDCGKKRWSWRIDRPASQ